MNILVNTKTGFDNIDTSNLSRSELLNLVANKNFIIDFIKKDGTKKIVNATTNIKLIPDYKKTKKENNRNVITAYDLENNEWKSFKINSINEIKIYN